MAKTPMSAEHKKALAEGRARGRAVKAYLEALEETRPKRGRKRTPDSIRARLAKIETDMADAGVLKRLELTQEVKDLEAELQQLQNNSGPDMAALEKDFVANAKAYGESKGIGYGTWRDFGVEASVLKAAGIGRGG